MDVERWDRIKGLFEAALDRPEADREQFLAEACQGREDLLVDVKSLLSSEKEFGDFLEQPVVRLPASPENDDLPPLFSPGEIVAERFQILRFIGRGGMGEVYEARDLARKVWVALKTVRSQIASDSKTMVRFKNEIELSLRVSHRNICRVYDLERHRPPEGSGAPDVVFLTMELLEGETLADRLRRQGRMSSEEALPLIRQMADGLAAAHKEGVVHCDFKPSNVMLVGPVRAESWQETHSLSQAELTVAASKGTRVRAVITDFGLARAMHPVVTRESIQESVDSGDHLVGTLPYMAPEQLEGKPATPASDVYAFGLVVYEMVTGCQPFSGATPLSGIYKRLEAVPTRPRKLAPDVSGGLDSVIMRCLERQPENRFADAQEVTAALNREGLRRPAGRLAGPRKLVLAGVITALAFTLSLRFLERAQARGATTGLYSPWGSVRREIWVAIAVGVAIAVILIIQPGLRRAISAVWRKISRRRADRIGAERSIQEAVLERSPALPTPVRGQAKSPKAPASSPDLEQLNWSPLSADTIDEVAPSQSILARDAATSAKEPARSVSLGPADRTDARGSVEEALPESALPRSTLATDHVTSPKEPATPPGGSGGGDSTRAFEIRKPLFPRVHLTFLSSVDTFLVGQSVPVTEIPFLMGRSGRHLAIASDAALSRDHAVIDWNSKSFAISDMGSANGTYLNGRRLQPDQPEPLAFGAKIRLSRSTLLSFVSDDLCELPDFTGQVLCNRFELVKRIRASVKAAVYEARDLRLARLVAAKLLSPRLTAFPGYVDQFNREAKIAADLRHPRICKILDFGQASLRFVGEEVPQVSYLCMELLDGGTLGDRLAADRRIPLEQVVRWLAGLTDALVYVHQRGVVHSDLKPTSIMFDASDNPYITDFSIATSPGESNRKVLFGAPDFLAPEQWEGSDPTAGTDQYAMGALTYLMLTGSPPHEGQQDPDARERNFARGPVPAHEQATRAGAGGLPPAISGVLMRSLSYKPDDRFPSIKDFFIAFQRAASNPPPGPQDAPQIFISYKRDVSSGWAVHFAAQLKDKHQISAFVDTHRVDSAVQIPAKIRDAIHNCRVFVCLLGKSTLRSGWVQEEIRLAWEKGKPMIPVFQEGFVRPRAGEPISPHIEALINFDGVHLFDRQNIHIDHSIADLAKMVTQSIREQTREC
jgi:serine/threonine protein kinase